MILYASVQNRWLVLGLIWLVFVVHGIDRSVLLVDSVQTEGS